MFIIAAVYYSTHTNAIIVLTVHSLYFYFWPETIMKNTCSLLNCKDYWKSPYEEVLTWDVLYMYPSTCTASLPHEEGLIIHMYTCTCKPPPIDPILSYLHKTFWPEMRDHVVYSFGWTCINVNTPGPTPRAITPRQNWSIQTKTRGINTIIWQWLFAWLWGWLPL